MTRSRGADDESGISGRGVALILVGIVILLVGGGQACTFTNGTRDAVTRFADARRSGTERELLPTPTEDGRAAEAAAAQSKFMVIYNWKLRASGAVERGCVATLLWTSGGPRAVDFLLQRDGERLRVVDAAVARDCVCQAQRNSDCQIVE